MYKRQVLKSVATGAAGSKQLDFFGEKILHGDYTPGFFMKHFIKDMKIALIEANQCELDLDVLSQTLANYEVLEAEGYEMCIRDRFLTLPTKQWR